MKETIQIGQRVVVVNPPDKDCRRTIIWGVGKVSFVAADAVEVMFDNGSGGMFSPRSIRPEPKTWAETADFLRHVGWTTECKPLPGFPPFLWRSRDGISGSDYRSDSPDAPPEAVMNEACRRGDIYFTHLTTG